MWLSSDVQGDCVAAVEGAETTINKGAIKVKNAQIDQLILNAHISKLCGRMSPPFLMRRLIYVPSTIKIFVLFLQLLSERLVKTVKYCCLFDITLPVLPATTRP